MNTNMNPDAYGGPTDAEIDHEVAELRQLLESVEGPSEPHPAYWQNFVVHVHGRIDGERSRRRRWGMVTRFASVGAAVLVVALAVDGVLSPNGGGVLRVPSGSVQNGPIAQQPTPETWSSDKGQSIILSQNDVQMLNAILTDDDDGIFKAIVDNHEM